VLGTKGTINSQSYQKAILHLDSKVTLFPLACPLFVPLVEEGYIDHVATRLIVEEYLTPLIKQKIDTLVLGCTHYPLLRDVIRSIVRDDVEIVDSAAACALEVERVLVDSNFKRKLQDVPRYEFYVSDDPEKFRVLGGKFLGRQIGRVIDIDNNFLKRKVFL
jgi:glutamate racemase